MIFQPHLQLRLILLLGIILLSIPTAVGQYDFQEIEFPDPNQKQRGRKQIAIETENVTKKGMYIEDLNWNKKVESLEPFSIDLAFSYVPSLSYKSIVKIQAIGFLVQDGKAISVCDKTLQVTSPLAAISTMPHRGVFSFQFHPNTPYKNDKIKVLFAIQILSPRKSKRIEWHEFFIPVDQHTLYDPVEDGHWNYLVNYNRKWQRDRDPNSVARPPHKVLIGDWVYNIKTRDQNVPLNLKFKLEGKVEVSGLSQFAFSKVDQVESNYKIHAGYTIPNWNYVRRQADLIVFDPPLILPIGIDKVDTFKRCYIKVEEERIKKWNSSYLALNAQFGNKNLKEVNFISKLEEKRRSVYNNMSQPKCGEVEFSDITFKKVGNGLFGSTFEADCGTVTRYSYQILALVEGVPIGEGIVRWSVCGNLESLVDPYMLSITGSNKTHAIYGDTKTKRWEVACRYMKDYLTNNIDQQAVLEGALEIELKNINIHYYKEYRKHFSQLLHRSGKYTKEEISQFSGAFPSEYQAAVSEDYKFQEYPGSESLRGCNVDTQIESLKERHREEVLNRIIMMTLLTKPNLSTSDLSSILKTSEKLIEEIRDNIN